MQVPKRLFARIFNRCYRSSAAFGALVSLTAAMQAVPFSWKAALKTADRRPFPSFQHMQTHDEDTPEVGIGRCTLIITALYLVRADTRLRGKVTLPPPPAAMSGHCVYGRRLTPRFSPHASGDLQLHCGSLR